MTTSISLGTEHFKEANERVRACLESHNVVELRDVFAQRYLGCAMPEGKQLKIYGTPGNDMASYMDGGSIEVFGNAQDQIGNTMNDGTIVIHGRCGDAAGYAMRGGHIFVRDDCGWRVGINMKQYKDKHPVIFIGGNAGSFLGEYMAGGTIVLLGSVGSYLGTGMHGGKMFLAEAPAAENLAEGVEVVSLDAADEEELQQLIASYSAYFPEYISRIPALTQFKKLVPVSSRPYANLYTSSL